MGEMEIENFNLIDKTVVKYYKKIMNRNTEKEKKEVLENLKKLVENLKAPNRNKIQIAIDEAESALKPEEIYPFSVFNPNKFNGFQSNPQAKTSKNSEFTKDSPMFK